VTQFEFLIELQSLQKRVFPSWNRRGGRATKKCREASIKRRGRGGQLRRMLQKCIAKRFVATDHPVCAASEAVFILNGAATLPFQEGNTLASGLSLTHSKA
jgi:hypothetical protein